MSANLPMVLSGFYLEIGSQDFPANMRLDVPFGFESGSQVPVFKYSLNDVENSFIIPRKLMRPDGTLIDRTRAMYLEGYVPLSDGTGEDTVAMDAIGAIDINAINWRNIFNIISFIYRNQATILTSSPSSPTYLSWGDEQLSAPTVGGAANPNYVSTYTAKSLGVVASNLVGRIVSVRFQADVGAGIIREFVFYFSADSFVERTDGAIFSVYRFLENPGTEDGLVDQTEFKDQIITKVFEILRSGKYKRFDELKINKKIAKKDINGDVIPGEYEEILEQFFVFSSYAQTTTVPMEVLLTKIKDYLRKIDTFANLRLTYPTLFTEDTVLILPIWENTTALPGDVEFTSHPLNIKTLKTLLMNNSLPFDPDNPDAKALEMFYVGSESSDPTLNAVHTYPLVAVELEGTSGVENPLSDRYPAFIPLHGVTYTYMNQEWQRFHHYLITALNRLAGITSTISNSTFVDSIGMVFYPKNSPDANQYKEGRDIIKFTLNGVIWVIVGMPTP